MKGMRWVVWLVEATAVMAAAVLLVHWRVFFNKVMPRVMVSGIEVSGVDRRDLEEFLQRKFEESPNEIVIKYEGRDLEKVDDLQVSYDYGWTADLAISVGRSGNLLTQIKERVISFFEPLEIEPAISYDKEELTGLVSLVGAKIKRDYVPARIEVDADGQPRFVAGVDGVWVNEKKLTELIIKAMKRPGRQIINVPTENKLADFDEEGIKKALDVANRWIGRSMVFTYEDFRMELPTKETMSLIGVNKSYLNKTAFDELFLLLEKKVNREPRDAVFRFKDGKVEEFRADLKGVELDKEQLKNMLEEEILGQVQDDMVEVVLPVKLTDPKIKASEINDLGIRELLGRGRSKFSHSIPSRVFNVALAARRINYALIPPGEVFSFNKEVGEISASTGYRSAYVIKDGRTVLGDGGGTCQVSTTMFRAAMDAGLPIVERKAHSYRVSYYEQDSEPGIDATVYAPTADLKFLNDTPGNILIQTTVDTKNMTMKIDIYGTSDGRVSSVSRPKIWGQAPPPEPLYEDDPTLPMGVVKQIDWAAWGAKTSFDYRVERDGEVIFEKTFYSNFKPWQAVYLRGVGKI